MTKPISGIVRPDRRIAARIETLAFLFDVSPATVERAVKAGKLKPSNYLGPVLYNVDDVEKLIFSGDIEPDAPAASDSPGLPQPSDDPSVRAILEKTNRINGTAAGRA